jgi:hypothetical protein
MGISSRASGPERGHERRRGTVNEPIYRWECTICDASGVSESSEMARLTVDTHVAVAHPDETPDDRFPEPRSQRIT